MVITYTIITLIITYIFGAITSAFIDKIPNKYIPIQNVVIGITSGLICYFLGIEPDIVQALALCLVASVGAGGTADLKNITVNKK